MVHRVAKVKQRWAAKIKSTRKTKPWAGRRGMHNCSRLGETEHKMSCSAVVCTGEVPHPGGAWGVFLLSFLPFGRSFSFSFSLSWAIFLCWQLFTIFLSYSPGFVHYFRCPLQGIAGLMKIRRGVLQKRKMRRWVHLELSQKRCFYPTRQCMEVGLLTKHSLEMRADGGWLLLWIFGGRRTGKVRVWR